MVVILITIQIVDASYTVSIYLTVLSSPEMLPPSFEFDLAGYPLVTLKGNHLVTNKTNAYSSLVVM